MRRRQRPVARNRGTIKDQAKGGVGWGEGVSETGALATYTAAREAQANETRTLHPLDTCVSRIKNKKIKNFKGGAGPG